jgi:hypothetical protein
MDLRNNFSKFHRSICCLRNNIDETLSINSVPRRKTTYVQSKSTSNETDSRCASYSNG